MPSSTSSSDGSRGRWPAAFLISLGLFALSEHLIWSNEHFLRFTARYKPASRVGDPLIPTTSVLFHPKDASPPLILLGSSQVREGLDCRFFEARLPGRRCRNMGISAGSPLDILYIARALDSVAPRRTTVTGLFPKILHSDVKKSFVDLETVRCLLASGSWKRLSVDDWTDVTFGLLESVSPTLRHKDALWKIYELVGDDLKGAWKSRLPPQPDRLLSEQDAMPPAYFERNIGKVNPDVKLGRFTPAQEEALERFIAGETARGNRVVVVDFPTRPGYETTLTPETAAHYQGLMDRLRRRNDIVFLSSADLPPLGVEDFLEFTHLAESGRQRVSERLAELVAGMEKGANSAVPGS